MQTQRDYVEQYKELNLLGKGNYGKAFRVKSLRENNYYVAKRIYLEGLQENQIKAAWGEIEILQKFNKLSVPFLVKYKECFQSDRQLVIIMEYCAGGDLATLIKNCREKNEMICEDIIAHWLIQLLWGLQALHCKQILHRDLKAANVFVTTSYILKIGDFGISKLLDTTSAKTCIGTPLYLSPQVCNAQPYSYSSDLWALGCILYQMCTLKYPFQASNLIVLAKKIVCDEVAPIPALYSRDLNDIVMKLLIKDNKKRITVSQIFKLPYIKGYLQTFQQQLGRFKNIFMSNNNGCQVPVVTNSFVKGNQQQTMKTINSVVEQTALQHKVEDTLEYSKSLTPQDQVRMRKAQKVQRQIEERTADVRKLAATRELAKEIKKTNLGQTYSSTMGDNRELKKRRLEEQYQKENKEEAERKYREKAMGQKMIIDLELIQKSIKNSRLNEENYNKSMQNTGFEEIPLPGNSSYFEKQAEIPIQIDEDQQLEEYYDEDFEEYTEGDLAKTVQKIQLQSVRAFYQNQTNSQKISPAKRQKINNVFKTQFIGSASKQDKVNSKKQYAISLVGKSRFQELDKQVRNKKINLKLIKEQFKEAQCNAIRIIEELMFMEQCL